MKKGECSTLGDTPALADFTNIITWLGQIGTWFWARFTEFATMVKGTPILLWFIVASIVFTSIGLLIRILKKMGFRGRRS